MADLFLRTPIDAGASRISLLTPDGKTLTDLNTPADDRMHVRDAAFGDYRAVVEPLGGNAQFYSFSFGPQTDVVDLGGASPTASQPLDASVEPSRAAAPNDPPTAEQAKPRVPLTDAGLSAAPQSSYDDPLFFLGRKAAGQAMSAVQTASVDVAAELPKDDGLFALIPSEAVPSETLTAAKRHVAGGGAPGPDVTLSVGLSHDSKPFDPGGWRPFRDQTLRVFDRSDTSMTLLFDRQHSTLPTPADARLRLSARLIGGPVYRMLVPLFDGGIRITFNARPDGSGEIDAEVTPLDPDRLALSQVLAAGAGSEGATILDQFTARNDLVHYIGADAPEDPWTAILGLLVGIRFAKLADREGELVQDLVQRYGWISDALILEARRLIMLSTARGEDFDANRNRSLATLKRARRVGAPYFYYSNAMVSDILAALASRPGEDAMSETQDPFELAVADERSRWQRFIRWQGQAGAFFTWRTHRRLTNARAFDPRYISPIS